MVHADRAGRSRPPNRDVAVPFASIRRPRVTFEVDLSVGAEIEGRLFISVRTAETHRAHILKKLHLTTRAELVHYALHHGLLTDDGAAA